MVIIRKSFLDVIIFISSRFKSKPFPYIAQSTGAVEYTNCTSAEGQDPTPTSVLYMTLKTI